MSHTVWGPGTRSRLYKSTGFMFLCWAAHYLPFWLMARQRFLHHYLPAHLASTLVTGALVEFMFNVDPIPVKPYEPDSSGQDKPRFVSAQERMSRQSFIATWSATIVILAATIYGFLFFAPLTYGTPGLDVAGVIARKWLPYELHFAK
jgi:dolichyl-phosphate-mannose-protein mannosyltransferase